MSDPRTGCSEYDEFSKRPSIDPAPAGFTGLVVGAIVVLGALIAFLMFRSDEPDVDTARMQSEVAQAIKATRYFATPSSQVFVRIPLQGAYIVGATDAYVRQEWERANPGRYLFLCSRHSGFIECTVAITAKTLE